MSLVHLNFLEVKHSISILLCLLATALWSQDLESLRAGAEANIRAGNFSTALSAYQNYNENKPGNADILTGIGICFFELGQLDKAQNQFREILEKEDSPPTEVYRYLGKLHHAKYEFEAAIQSYKLFLKNTGSNHPLRAAVKDEILRCANGIKVRRQKIQAGVVSLSAPVNSAGDEFRPLLAPGSPNRIYFSFTQKMERGNENIRSDLYFTDLRQGDWTEPQPLSIFLNTSEHEIPQGFDECGQIIYFFRGKTQLAGDIFFDTLRENKMDGTLFVPKFDSPARAWEGDQDLYFFNDTILLFASRRVGGYGGLDLYICHRGIDGWSAPENLGPVINTPYDETSPFLARDGRTLYFSTNDARKSIGGLDIVRSVYLDRVRKWIPPENLGIPFNSAGDDEHFFLTPNGTRAFFSSDRKQGLGRRDIYVGLFDQVKGEQLATSEPVVFQFVRPESKTAAKAPQRPATTSATTLNLAPLRYPLPNMPLTEASFAKLNELVEWMKKRPELQVTFAAHTAAEDDRSIANSALQQVTEVLENQEISLENVSLRNAGATYPLAGNDDPEANRRIDILIANPEVLPVEIRQEEITASKARFFRQAMNRLVFQIKIPMENGEAPDSLLASFPDGTLLEFPASGQTQFINGTYLTWASAVAAEQNMQSNGFANARATPYLHGWELTKEQAAELVGAFPELEGFVQK